MRRNIKDGRWVICNNITEFSSQLDGRCNYESFTSQGPGKYLRLDYKERCPRNCCYDDVTELLSKNEVIAEVKEEIIELSNLLKEARSA